MTDKNIKKLLDDSRDYLYNEADYLKLDLSQKLARVLGVMILLFVLLQIILVTVVFASIALVDLLSVWMPTAAAYATVGILYLLTIALSLYFRERLLFRPLTAMLAEILLGGEVSANDIDREQQRLKAKAELGTKMIEEDYQAVKTDLSQPLTYLSLVKHIPSVISVIATLIPLFKKMKFKRQK